MIGALGRVARDISVVDGDAGEEGLLVAEEPRALGLGRVRTAEVPQPCGQGGDLLDGRRARDLVELVGVVGSHAYLLRSALGVRVAVGWDAGAGGEVGGVPSAA